MKKPAKGKGYTVRIKGRKCLAASILEKQVEEARRQFEELQVQNELLRTKEAMQLEALAGWEALLQQLAAMPDPTATDEERATKLVSAAMLDMQALKLQQELRPAKVDAGASATATSATPAAVNSHSCDDSHTSSSTGKASQAATSLEYSSSSINGGGSSSPAAASSSLSSRLGCHSGSLAEGSVRLPHVMAMLDPSEIPALKQLTLAEMAGCVRCALDKVIAARDQAEDPMSDAAIVAAMREYAKVMIGHSIANNEQHTRLGTVNLETLQPETPSEEHIEGIVAALQLQPQQVQHISRAFHTNSQSEAQLMRQQEKLRQQLQDLLAPKALPADAGRPSSQPGAGSSQGAVAAGSTDAAAGAATEPVSKAAVGCSDGHSVRDKAGALLAVVSGGQQGLSPGDLAWLTRAGVDVGADPQQTKELAAAGCLSVQAAANAEALLAQLSKLVFAQQQQSRALIMMWINLLTPEQQAAAVIAAYPYLVHQARVCAKIAAMNAANTQR